MAVGSRIQGVLTEKGGGKREEIIELLTKAYWIELESVMNYLAASVNVRRGQEIAEALEVHLEEELQHAKQLARRIGELGGTVPGSVDFKAEEMYLQPSETRADVIGVITGVIEAERAAIEHCNRIVEETRELDWATQEMVVQILRDEEVHLRLFEEFLHEYEVQGLA